MPTDPTSPAPGPVVAGIDAGLAVAGQVAQFIPNPLVQAIIILAARFGPAVIGRIETVLAMKQVTIADMHGIFSDLEPYDFFGIPDVATAPPAKAP
jgi:hypothetical protein